MWTGERQSTKMRIKYLEAALNQDIQYFDTEVRTSDVVFAINTDAVMVQDAISEKVPKLNQSSSFFVSFLLICSILVIDHSVFSWVISFTTWLPSFLDSSWVSRRFGN